MPKMKKEQIERASSIMRTISEASSGLEELAEELQGQFDEKSERWQGSDAGTEFQEMIDYVTEARDGCDEVVGTLSNLEGVDL